VSLTDPATNGHIVLTARVVGLSELEACLTGRSAGRAVSPLSLTGRLQGISRVTVPSGSVVTPAVRDLLRDRNIRIVEQGESAGRGGAAQPAGMPRPTIVIAEGTNGAGVLAARLARDLSRDEGLSVERLGRSDLAALVGELAVRLVSRRSAPAVLLTHEPHAAVCLANRRSGVRAVHAQDADEMRRACRSVGANLIVLEPPSNAAREAEWVAMVKEFGRVAGNACPAAWRDTLA
jgi:hypothetical protein